MSRRGKIRSRCLQMGSTLFALNIGFQVHGDVLLGGRCVNSVSFKKSSHSIHLEKKMCTRWLIHFHIFFRDEISFQLLDKT